MKRMLKWTAIALGVVALVGLCAFLYFIPPFFITPPETFTQQMRDAMPPLDHISGPKERMLAERGREIVVRTGCNGCHAPAGPQGPDFNQFLAGGAFNSVQKSGRYISRNLTPDPETGLAKRTDAEIMRILRSGVFPDGHVSPLSAMPWAAFSNWTEEDRYAVVVFLRNIKPIRHRIPDADLTPQELPPGVVQADVTYKDE
jgi:mono/diheme cytochrome c family protein